MDKHNREYSNRKYKIIEYDPSWTNRFQQESEIIKSMFLEKILHIEHVGSTSVPGLAGKDLVDILVIVNSVDFVETLVDKMSSYGYKYYGDLLNTGSRFFDKEINNDKLVNLHIFPKGHPHIQDMLRLRDYLLKNKEEVTTYSQLKIDLYTKFPDDYAEYRSHKNIYMKGLMSRVLASYN